ncbi:hypothetical protein EZ428_17830 [Pedobacter frigiditerrae]|uniref:DUF6965 domain-containing protein n=1 Tax=Pedobacter frigiditerrae TaxID=2530452 RepID=A0A4R0MPF5_9SPHI|nr:hypothetical protein [Pedobacter frigiditerrae]TCC88503.1 hypothetical protein EZ428_17830 [Pedobacter frigiditerrae]
MTIPELEQWFKSVELPAAPLYLNPATKINDVNYFLESHFSPLRDTPITSINQPLLDRLLAFKLLIESNL